MAFKSVLASLVRDSGRGRPRTDPRGRARLALEALEPREVPANHLPTVALPGNQVFEHDTVLGPLTVTAGDAETPAADLVVGATSDAQTLIPDANIQVGGTGAGRTVTVTPTPGASGVANILVSVTDADGGQTVKAFSVRVRDAATLVPAGYTENFNGPDNAFLGGPWDETAGDHARAGSRAVAVKSRSVAVLNGVNEADVAVSAAVALAPGSGRFAALVARYGGPGDANHYAGGITANPDGSFTAYILRNVNGSPVPLASRAVGTGTGTLRFEALGSSLKLFLDSAVVAFANDTALATGSVGIRAVGAGITFDNFQAQRLTPLVPTLPFADGFNGQPTDQLTLHWQEKAGNFKVVTDPNNAGNNVAAGNGSDNLAVLNGVSAADVVVQAQVKGLAAGQLIGLVARYSGAGMGNGYQARLYISGGTARAAIFRYQGGVGTRISADVAVGPAAGVLGGALRFELQGDSLKLFLGNTLLAFAHDKAFPAGGVGVRVAGAASVDNFQAARAPFPANGSLGTTYTFESPQRPDGQLDNVWAEPAGNFQVATVAGNNVAAGNGPDNLAILNGVSVPDVVVLAQVKGLDAGEAVGLVARYGAVGTGSGYQARLYNSGGTARAAIFRTGVGADAGTRTRSTPVVSGTGTEARISADVAAGPAASVFNATLRFEVVGDSLKLFLGNTLLASAHDTAISGAGGVGVRAAGAASVDNFRADLPQPSANGSLGTTYTFESPQRSDGQLDSVWTERAGNFQVATVAGNNVARGNGPDNLATLNGISAANVVVQAQVKGLGAGEAVGLAARYSGTGSGYQARLYNTGGTARAAIFRVAPDTGTGNGTRSAPVVSGALVGTRISADVAVGPAASVLGGALRFELQGDSLKLFLGNTLLASAHDTTISGAGGVGMRTVGSAALDNFRSDMAPSPANGSLGTTYTFESPQRPDGQLDNVWTERAGNFQVATVAGNNVARGNGPDNLATLNGVSAANVFVQAQVKGLGAGEAIGLVARYSGPGLNNNYTGLIYNSGGTARAAIYRNLNGTWTLLGSDVAVGPAASVLNTTLRFEVSANSLKLFVGGNLVSDVTDMAITGPGGVGMRVVGMASLDNALANTLP